MLDPTGCTHGALRTDVVIATIGDGAGTSCKRTNVIFDEDQQDWDTRPNTKS